MHEARRRLVFATAAGLTGAGCLFSVPDVQRDATDAGAPADRADALAIDDVGDGAHEVALDAGPFCRGRSPAPRFCADFDDGTFGVGWAAVSQDSPGTLARITSDAFTSPPNAARFSTVEGVGGDTVSSAYFRAVTEARHERLAFDVKIEKFDPGDAFQLLYIGHDATDLRFDVTSVDGTRTVVSTVEEFQGGLERQWSTSPLVGRWMRVVVDLVLAPSPHVSVHAIDRDTATDMLVVDTDLSASWTSGKPFFAVGLAYAQGPHEKSVLLDGIVFDFE